MHFVEFFRLGLRRVRVCLRSASIWALWAVLVFLSSRFPDATFDPLWSWLLPCSCLYNRYPYYRPDVRPCSPPFHTYPTSSHISPCFLTIAWPGGADSTLDALTTLSRTDFGKTWPLQGIACSNTVWTISGMTWPHIRLHRSTKLTASSSCRPWSSFRSCAALAWLVLSSSRPKWRNSNYDTLRPHLWGNQRSP